MKLSAITENRQVHAIQDAVRRFGDPAAVQTLVNKIGARDLDDLIAKLEASPQVRAVLDAYRKAKENGLKAERGDVHTESIVGDAGRALLGVVKAGISTVANTVSKLLTPFKSGYEAPAVAKATYAGTLLMTAALSGLLLSAGATGPAIAPWGLLWFGWNFIEPMIAKTDRVR